MNKSIPIQFSGTRGSALIFSLVILTVITITSMVAMQRSTLQLRMVNSMQRDQQVFNAAFNYLAQGYFKVNDDPVNTLTMLSTLIDTTNAVDPYSVNNWTKPDLPLTVGSVVGSVSGEKINVSNNTRYLKGNQNNSSGGETTYYFSYLVKSTDKGTGRISSTQEVGLSIVAPAIGE